MLSRFKQSTRETFKSSAKEQKTEIPSDVNSLILKGDGVTTLYNDLIKKAHVYFPELKIKTKHADDPAKAQSIYALAESFESLAGEYRSQPDDARFFSAAASTMHSLAKLKSELDLGVHESYIEPKQSLLQDQIKEANAHFEKIKTRRLDLDGKKHKLKTELKSEEGSKLKKYEMEVHAAQERFDDEIEAVRQLLGPVLDEAEMAKAQRMQASQMLKAMKAYFSESLQALEALDERLNFEGTHETKSLPRSTRTTESAPKSTPPPVRARSVTAPPAMLMSKPSVAAPPIVVAKPKPMVDKPPVLASKPKAPMGHATPFAAASGATNAKPVSSAIAQRQAALFASQPPVMARNTREEAQERCRALYDFEAEQPSDLALMRGDVVVVLDRSKGDWWSGRLERTGETGHFPGNYVELF